MVLGSTTPKSKPTEQMCKPMWAYKICESSYTRFQKEKFMQNSFSCLNRISLQFNMGSLPLVLSQWAWLKSDPVCLLPPTRHLQRQRASSSLLCSTLNRLSWTLLVCQMLQSLNNPSGPLLDWFQCALLFLCWPAQNFAQYWRSQIQLFTCRIFQ